MGPCPEKTKANLPFNAPVNICSASENMSVIISAAGCLF
jgi:hypothetical protein